MANTNRTFATSLLFLSTLVSFSHVAGGVDEVDDEHIGLTEYEIACMPCHGIRGRGDGPRAKTLKTPPADLTGIAKSNGGAFPFQKVTEIIDGRTMVSGHGTREMPVWGERYQVPLEESESPAKIEERARAQIKALVRYLEIIQEN